MVAKREHSSDLLIHTSGDHQCRRCVQCERDELGDTYYCHRDRALACRSSGAMNRAMGPLVENGMVCCKFGGSEAP